MTTQQRFKTLYNSLLGCNGQRHTRDNPAANRPKIGLFFRSSRNGDVCFLTHGSFHLFQEIVHKFGVIVLFDFALEDFTRQYDTQVGDLVAHDAP